MRRTLIIAMAWALGLSLSADNAHATTLTVGDLYYAGLVRDGTPSSEAWQVVYINTFIGLPAGQPDTLVGSETYSTEESTLAGVPAAFLAGSMRDETGAYGGIDVTGFSYILGKYGGHKPGAGVFVWYVAGLTSVDLPQRSPGGYELGHYTLFAGGGGGQSVPDGGATLMMLGGGLVGLEALRRRFRA